MTSNESAVDMVTFRRNMKMETLEKIKEDPKIRCLPDRFLAYMKWGVDNVEREEEMSTWVCNKHSSEEHAKKVVLQWSLDKMTNSQQRTSFHKRVKTGFFERNGIKNPKCTCGSGVSHEWIKGDWTQPFKDYLERDKNHETGEEMLGRKAEFDKTVNNIRLSYAAHGRLGNTANPKIIAAGLMYLLGVRWGLWLTQTDVARSFGISPVSIRSGYISVKRGWSND
jgi:hypothetical protein